jgi:hypothetical protein
MVLYRMGNMLQTACRNLCIVTAKCELQVTENKKAMLVDRLVTKNSLDIFQKKV